MDATTCTTTTPTTCRDWCYAPTVTVTRIVDEPYTYGYTVRGPRGMVSCVRVEAGDWWLFGAHRSDGSPVYFRHNGNWSHGFAMSLARRFVNSRDVDHLLRAELFRGVPRTDALNSAEHIAMQARYGLTDF